MRNTLTAEKLRELLDYDMQTGIFTWKETNDKHQAGEDARIISPSTGVTRVCIDHVYHLAHRLVFLHVFGFHPSYSIKHIDGDKSNNKLINLMDTAKREQEKQAPKGVSFDKTHGLWRVRSAYAGKKYSLGYYYSKDKAVGVYNKFMWAVDKSAFVKELRHGR